MEKRFFGQKEDRACETALDSKFILLLQEREGKVLIKRELLSFKEIVVGICSMK